MKRILDYFYKKTHGYYPFFQYCPKSYRDHYVKQRAFDILHKDYNWTIPKTFNEKVRWLMFNNKLEEKTELTDKLKVKKWVADKIGEEYVAKVYDIQTKFDLIDFSKLPEKFALKTNHGWQMNFLVTDKTFFLENQKKEAKKKFDKWLKTNYFYYSIEPQYFNIRPQIFAEHLREINGQRHISDYKVYCFHGEPEFIEHSVFISPEKGSKCTMHDTNWNKLNFGYFNPVYEHDIPKPQFLNKMLKFAKILSKDFIFVRVDFSETETELYFGEMTFSPASAMMNFTPDYMDAELGKLIKLPFEN